MGWTNLPATPGLDIQDHGFIRQFWFALRERYQASGRAIWPESSMPWYSGLVPAGGISNVSLTDPNANDGNGWCDATHDNPWDCSAGPVRTSPGSAGWYLVFDHCDDPTKVVKTRITSWTSTTLNFESIADHVVAGYVTLADLGPKYYIIRGDWGLWWHERFLEYPNDYEYAAGTVTAYFDDANNPTVRTDPTDHSLKDAAGQWAVDEHAGRDLLVYAEDGSLKRVSVSSNTADTLSFSTQGWAPKVDGKYSVVAAEGKAYPGKPPVYPYAWYRGHFDSASAHYPAPESNSYLHGTDIPAITVGHPDVGSYGDCITKYEDAFDQDVHLAIDPSDEQLDCGYPPDKFLSPDFWKSLRAIQCGCQDVCGYFVEDKSYDGLPAIPRFVDATFFKAAGINAVTAVISGVDAGGGAVLNLSLPYATPIELYYAVLDRSGTPYKFGTLTATSNTHVTGAFEDLPAPGNSDVGRTVVLSPGWSRLIPREFRRMFDKTCFIPDMVDVPQVAVENPSVLDFATSGCTGVGSWLTRPRSAAYVEQDKLGPVDTEPFVTGDVARYVGDNWNDPINAAEPLVKYFDHYYTGQFPAAVQLTIDGQRSGSATAGGTTFLTDTSQDWWDAQWYEPSSNMHVESGTAGTGSTTTSLRDTSKAAGADNCWWATSRFPDASGPYVGFTVEIVTSGVDFDDVDAVIEKRLITSGDATLVSIGWVEPLSTTWQGKPYRIREPRGYELNRWKGRRLRLTKPDATVIETTILGNDDQTLFFADVGFAVASGTPYEIVDPPVGTIWQWSGNRWINPVPDGCVERVPPPTSVRRYGRFWKGDYLTAALFNELYRAINALRRTKHLASWDSRADDAVPEENNDIGFDGDSTMGSLGDDKTHASNRYGGADEGFDPLSEQSGAPYAQGVLNRFGDRYPGPSGVEDISHGAYLRRQYAYPVVTGLPQGCALPTSHMSCSVEWYAYSWIDQADHPPGDPLGSGSNYRFDANGDPVQYHKWTLVASAGAANTPDRKGMKVGSLSQPDWPLDPSLDSPPWDRSNYAGYWIADQATIAKWNFSYV